MQVTDVRDAADDGLTVQLAHQAQNAVGRGVLRSQVE